MDPSARTPQAAEPLRRQSLAALRARAAALGSVEALRRLGRALADDPRAGARALGERCVRRAERRAAGERKLGRMLERRDALLAAGARAVAGVDEVGVGPLAGPVVAAAVVLPRDCDLVGLDDSKKVPRAARERLAAAIREQAVAVGIGRAEVEEIDRINVYRAALEAMRRAVEALAADCAPDHLLVDARTVPGVSVRQSAIVHGDARDASIAAASIVAKVYRDAHMAELDGRHPGYGFARHMGYGTAEHLHALRELGPSPVHRHSFAPVAEAARR